MSITPEPFAYTRLKRNEIRLLFTSVEDDTVEFRLETVHLAEEETISYDALSYTWGDQGHTFPILCNGQGLQIHRNLNDALPFLARRRSPRPIWIDALCINQSDEIEKGDQVRSMHQVYRLATEVLVWLGCGTEETPKAVAMLPQLNKVGSECKDLEASLPNSTLESHGLPSLSSSIWDAFYDIFQHKWFRRVWTVQEAALAKTVRVLCADQEIAWSDLEEAMDNVRHVNALHDASNRKTQFRLEDSLTIFLVRNNTQDRELEGAMGNAKLSAATFLAKVITLISTSHECYEPRDRVFGVLGLVKETDVSVLNLDYSLSLETLYTRFCQFILTGGEDLYVRAWWVILNMATSLNKIEGLPSWCPDLHRQGPGNHNFVIHQIFQGENNAKYRASRRPSYWRPGATSGEIILRGRIVDTIDYVFPSMPDYNKVTGEKWFSELGLWEQSIAQQVLGPNAVVQPPTMTISSADIDGGCISIDDYWRTLVGGITTKFGRILSYDTLSDCREVWRSVNKYTEAISELMAESGYSETEARKLAEGRLSDDEVKTWDYLLPEAPPVYMMSNMWSHQAGRRLFTTHKHHFGFAIQGIQENDVVCCFDGGTSPHVLRKVDGSGDGDRYVLVGEAYLHRYMHGEVDKLNIEEEYITLI